MRALVAGNWKMNGTGAELEQLAQLKAGLAASPPDCDVLVCPPATLLARAQMTVQGAFALGGQDCAAQSHGAFTGDIAAAMLKDAGASFVIVGHSERRHLHGETDAQVAAKAQAALQAGLKPIICVGETEAQRAAGDAHHICSRQLDGSIPHEATGETIAVAYEPVWAIGTGKTATLDDIAAMHAHIRFCLVRRLGEGARTIAILYGGSVKPDNAAAILAVPEVGGALVGGASLKAAEFLKIIAAVKAG